MILTMHRQESFSLNSTRNRFHGYSARNYFPEIDQKMLMFRGYSARNYYPEINKKAVSQIFSKQLLSQLFSKKYFPWTRQEISIGGYFSKKLLPPEIDKKSVIQQEVISLNSARNQFLGYSARIDFPKLRNKSVLRLLGKKLFAWTRQQISFADATRNEFQW